MLPRKILKMEPLKLAKNVFPAYASRETAREGGGRFGRSK